MIIKEMFQKELNLSNYPSKLIGHT